MTTRYQPGWLLLLVTALIATPTARAQEASDGARRRTVMETAAAHEELSVFVAAIKVADLVKPLSDDGPFTLFIPANEAFDALPDGTLKNWLKPENKEKLQAILKYHIVSGRVLTSDIAKIERAKTLQSDSLHFAASDEGVVIEQAKITKPDIECSNGVIHVIDKVMRPK